MPINEETDRNDAAEPQTLDTDVQALSPEEAKRLDKARAVGGSHHAAGGPDPAPTLPSQPHQG